jgi:hypothetical protein
VDDAINRNCDAEVEVLTTPPTTLAGVIALLEYAGDQDHIWGPGPWNEQRKDRGSQREATAVSPTQESNAGRQRRAPGPKADVKRLGYRNDLGPRESFSLAVFEFGAHGSSLSTRSTGRPAHLHGLLPPILSAHGYDLAHLLWYVYRDLFLLSRCLLSGCTHRRYDHNDRDRG